MGFYKAKPLVHFTSRGLGATADFSETSEGFLEKKLLVLVEGTHIDSKKRVHNFPKERIIDIAERSNAAFENGARIPLLTDHNKTQFSTVGDLDSTFEVAVITEDNLPNPKHRHLLGKLGIFAERAIIKSKNAIEQAKQGLLSTISPGIDPLTNEIKEISFTPTPAITGLMAFKNSYNSEFNSQALSFDELEQEGQEQDELEQQYMELAQSLWTITTNAMQLTDDDQVDPQQVIEQALQDFADRYMLLLGMDGQDEQQSYEQQQAGGYPPQQSVQGAAQPPMAEYNRAPVAAFSMAELEYLNNIEFAKGRGKDKKKRKSRLIRNLAIGATGLGTVGGLGYLAYKGRKLNIAEAAKKSAGMVEHNEAVLAKTGGKGLKESAAEGMAKVNEAAKANRGNRAAILDSAVNINSSGTYKPGTALANSYERRKQVASKLDKFAPKLARGRSNWTANRTMDKAINRPTKRTKFQKAKKWQIADPWD